MNLAELKARCFPRLDEAAGSSVSFSVAEVAAALNRGERLFAAMTLAIERTGSLELSRGQVWSNLLGAFPRWFLPLRCSRDTVSGVATTAIWGVPLWGESLWAEEDAEVITGKARIAPATLAELDALNASWRNAVGPDILRYGVRGFSLAYHYPAPAAATRIDYTYAAMPAGLVSDVDVPEIPDEYHGSLIAYAVYELPALKWGGEYVQKGIPLLQTFLDDAAKCAAYVRARSLSLRYDRQPFEITAEDRSRWVGKITAQIQDAQGVAQ